MMKSKTVVYRILIVFGLLLLSLWTNYSTAQISECLPKKPSISTPERGVYVHDFSNAFTPAEELRLSNNFQRFKDSTSNEIILIAPDTLCGIDVWDYGIKIGNTWKVGKDEFDNGLVIVYVAKTAESRGQIAVATGRGLEGALPDGAARIIIEQEMIPSFKKGQIIQGLNKGISVIEDILKEEYNYSSYKSDTKKKGADKSMYITLAIFGMIILFWLIQVGIYARTNKISFWKALVIMSQTKGNHSGRWRRFNGGFGGYGGYRGGGGSSGGGGFGGFGGGSFGGGGASGSW